MNRDYQRITACIPHYGCGRYVRRAVDGLLAQTHRNITVVVVNDGDPNPPWHWLSDIRDSRLIRFDLAGNYGPYLATAVVLNATSAPYFLIQDADDWSVPWRTEHLLGRLEEDGSDFAVSAQVHYAETASGPKDLGVRWAAISPPETVSRQFEVIRQITPEFVFRAPHHGLFRTASLRRIGGYYAGFRVSYDAMLTNLILMTGRISHLPQPLYYRAVRSESLTQSTATGMKSKFRRESEQAIANLYRRCYGPYRDYLARCIDSSQLAAAIRQFVSSNIPDEHACQLKREATRLNLQLARCGIESLV